MDLIDLVDRIGPDLPVTMEWRHVLFASWPVEPAVVDDHLPAALSPDTHDDRAWLSVVPLVNAAVRPPGLPRAVGVGLPELNLRTYVTCDGAPGVYFFSLDADGPAGVAGARLFHHLPYYFARVDLEETDDGVRFTSRRRHPGARPARFEATYAKTGDRFEAEPGSLAHFLVERYRYFTEAPDGSVRYGEIEHDPWPLYDATATVERNTVLRASGFAEPDADPVYLYSPGVAATGSESKVWDRT